MSLNTCAAQKFEPERLGELPKVDTICVPRPLLIAERGSLQIQLKMKFGGLRTLNLAYELIGLQSAPVIVVAGGISADRHVCASDTYIEQGWWEQQVGPDKTIDLNRFRVLAFNWLGSDGELDCPIDTADQANALKTLLQRLGIDSLNAFIGASYGAMVALQFALLVPTLVKQIIVISGADRAHPFAIAWRDLQRRIVHFGQLQGDESSALSLARQLAILSYRSPHEFAERFASPLRLINHRAHADSSNYLRHCGSKYVARTSPIAFLRLSESIDLHQVDAALIKVPICVIGVQEDFLVPPELLNRLVQSIPHCTDYHLVSSRFGHDAFLLETKIFSRLLSLALRKIETVGGAA